MARRHHRAHRGSSYQAMVCFPARRLLLRTTFEDPLELLALDLAAVSRGRAPDRCSGRASWEQVEGPLYGVCTHGRHDACCAERGRPVCAALSELRPEQTWEVSHIGGDRFAANLVVLPEGLYYGHVEPESVARPGRPARGRAASTSPGSAGARPSRCPSSTPRSRCADTSARTGSTPSG